ncbi:MAG: hypothetical protein H7289_13165 [Mucilaginibacter sp.]|nr:hypothetical protein [Mucilaginibacter sp.]
MKKLIGIRIKLLLPALLFSVFTNAQKLPVLQMVSVKAPANIKIDGKPTEWDNKFQAYNKGIQAFYTISNDDKKLYLTLQATKKEIINKIINGGVSFTVVKDNSQSVDDGATITFPVFDEKDRPNININAMAQLIAGSKDSEKMSDSLMKANNSILLDKAKLIRVSGIKDLDTLISMYNMDGVKARALFGKNMAYTYELSIDLKLLELSAADLTKFNYNITLNEVELDYVPGIVVTRNEDGGIINMNMPDPKLANSYISALSSTDCWGTYKLIK